MLSTFPVLISLALVACTGEVATQDTDTEVDTGADTAGPIDDGLWQPSAFNIAAGFAVDGENNSVVGWYQSTSADQQDPWVSLLLWEDATTAPDPDNLRRCEVIFFLPADGSVALEAWSFTDATNDQSIAHSGFMVPDSATVGRSECEGWDVEALGEPEAFVASNPWGVGVGTLRDDVRSKVGSDYPDSDWAELEEGGQLLGGSWSSTVWSPEIWASHVAFAAPLEDGMLSIDADGSPTTFLTLEEVTAGAELPSGYYGVRSIGAWDANAYLY